MWLYACTCTCIPPHRNWLHRSTRFSILALLVSAKLEPHTHATGEICPDGWSYHFYDSANITPTATATATATAETGEAGATGAAASTRTLREGVAHHNRAHHNRRLVAEGGG